MPEPVLSVQDLTVEFKTEDGIVHAVTGVSYDLFPGETLGVVGESGSGKSVSVMTMLGLVPMPPGRLVSGQALYKGEDLLRMSKRKLREIRGGQVAMIFQDPMTSLNPVLTIGDQIAEAIQVHNPGTSDGDARKRAIGLLELVGVPSAERRFDQYPHEFSGGMRQRTMIAMAIANDPDILIADEPTTALDVTIQAQVLEVLERIQDRTNSAIILITHDLGVVAGLADRVMVMYAGKQVELGTVEEIFYDSRHPYTLGLLASLPRLDEDTKGKRLHSIKGQPPSLIFVPSGCAFHPRCEFARLPEPCSTEVPGLLQSGAPGHMSACHFRDDLRQVTVASMPTGGVGEG